MTSNAAATICDHRLEIAEPGEKCTIRLWRCKCGQHTKTTKQLEQERALKLL